MDPFASALDQAAAVRRREASSVEITRAYLERIERLNPKLNAYVLLTPELALEQAGAADAANTGQPLCGVPVSIKDLVSVAGYPTTLGSKAFEDLVFPIDFFPVARLKEEGCPILGKTNLSEFGTRPVATNRCEPTRVVERACCWASNRMLPSDRLTRVAFALSTTSTPSCRIILATSSAMSGSSRASSWPAD